MSRWSLVLAAAVLCSTFCSVAGLQTISLASFASPHLPRHAIALSRRGQDTAGVGICSMSAMYKNLFDIMNQANATRRRKHQAMMQLSAALFSKEDDRGLFGGYLGPKSVRGRLDWEKHLIALTDREFYALYRFDKGSFHRLLRKVEAVEDSSERPRPIGPPWAPVEPELRLAMTLRWLAGCRYIGISTACGVAVGYFYEILWDTIDRISKALAIVSPYAPDEVREMGHS